MSPRSVISSRPARGLVEVRGVIEDVDDRLDAVCELLGLAREDSQISASAMRMLLQPLQAQLNRVRSDLADLPD